VKSVEGFWGEEHFATFIINSFPGKSAVVDKCNWTYNARQSHVVFCFKFLMVFIVHYLFLVWLSDLFHVQKGAAPVAQLG